MKKVVGAVHWGLKALVLPSKWYWRFKRAMTIIWLPLNGEPVLTNLLIKENGKNILVRVNRPEFFFRTKKVAVYDLEGIILIREIAIVERINDEEFEVENIIDEEPAQEEHSQANSQHQPSFSPWELIQGLQIEMPAVR